MFETGQSDQQRFANLLSKAVTMSDIKPAEQKIKGLDRKLKQSEIDFMKLIEEKNVKRVLKLKRTRKSNIITGKLHKFSKFSVIHN